MKTANRLRRQSLPWVLLAAGALGAGNFAAADEYLPPAARAAVEAPRPIPPSKAELVDSAFKKLAVGKDYVAREDAKALDNFMTIFDAADLNHDGRLNLEEFKKAWTAYAASDKADRG